MQGRRRACLYPQPPARHPRAAASACSVSDCLGASPAGGGGTGELRLCVGRVGGANTLELREEPGRLLVLIKVSFAMDLGSTGGASSLSVWGK